MQRTSKQQSVFPRANDWSMAKVWNDTIGNKPERPATARERVWASELGKPNIEIFLKMRGVPATNPPNQRSKRKFSAGNLFEWIVSIILKRAGILKSAQKWVGHQYPGLLEVSGKIDFVAGGIPDYENFEAKLKEMELPEDFLIASEAVVEHFKLKYPEGLADMYLEIKSCSSFMMNSMEKTNRSSRNHRLQLFHYLKSENYPRGNVVYICRDDLRMLEVPVQNPSEVEEEYKTAISEITGYYNRHKNTPIEKIIKQIGTDSEPQWVYNPMKLEGLPPLEKYVVWDDDLGKFARNWGVEYSSYLTMLYGFLTQLEFEEAVNPTVGRWNRVLARMKTANARSQWLLYCGKKEEDIMQDKIEGSRKKGLQYVCIDGTNVNLPDEIQKGYEMTPKNLEVIKEISANGFKVEELLAKFAGEGEELED